MSLNTTVRDVVWWAAVQFACIALKHPRFRKQSGASAHCGAAECCAVEAWAQTSPQLGKKQSSIPCRTAVKRATPPAPPTPKEFTTCWDFWLGESRAEFFSKPKVCGQLVTISVLSLVVPLPSGRLWSPLTEHLLPPRRIFKQMGFPATGSGNSAHPQILLFLPGLQALPGGGSCCSPQKSLF